MTRRFFQIRSRYTFLTITISLFVLTASFLSLIIGLIGQLNLYGAFAGATLMGIPAIFGLIKGPPLGAFEESLGERIKADFDLKESLPLILLLLTLISYHIGWNIVIGTYFTQDDHVYHASIPAAWILAEKIYLTAFTSQGYYALNAELLPLWLMVFFKNDSLVSMCNLIYCGLFIFSSVSIMEKLNINSILKFLPAIIFLSSSRTFSALIGFSDTHIVGGILLIVAYSLQLFIGEGTKKQFVLKLLLSSLLIGFACGIKVYFVIPGLTLALYSVYLCFQRSMYLLPIFLILSAFLGGGYWYFKNIILTGNPLYPAKLLFFDGPMDKDALNKMKLFYTYSDLSLSQLKDVILGIISPIPHTIISFLGMGYMIFQKGQGKNLSIWVLFLSAFVALVFFPFMPNSGTNEMGIIDTTSGRYLIFVYLVGCIGGGLLLIKIKNILKKDYIFNIVLFGLSTYCLLSDWKFIVVLVLYALIYILTYHEQFYGLILKLTTYIRVIIMGKRSVHQYFLISTMICLLAALASPIALKGNDRTSRRKYWMDKLIRRIPDGSRVSLYNDFLFWGYRLFGPRLNLEAVRLLNDGSIAKPMHLRSRPKGIDFWTFDKSLDPPKISSEKFVGNLINSKVNYIFIEKSLKGKWPIQHYLLEKQLKKNVFQEFKSDSGALWRIENND